MARRNISAGSMPVGVEQNESIPEVEAALDEEREAAVLKSFDNASPAEKSYLSQQVAKVLAAAGFAGFAPDPDAKKPKTVIKPMGQALLKAGEKAVDIYFSGRGSIGNIYHSKFVSLTGVGKHSGIPESVARRMEEDQPVNFKVL